MRLQALIVTALAICGLIHEGCAGDRFVLPPPMVRFTRPANAVLYLEGAGTVVRIHFNGKPRLAPVYCREQGHMYPTRKMNASVEYTLQRIAAGPGHRPFRLFDARGRLMAHGRLCIFPTRKTLDQHIKQGYTIHIAAEALTRVRAGQTAVGFQDYKPVIQAPKGWRHLAWVLSLSPP